jgi:hypothetical protein
MGFGRHVVGVAIGFLILVERVSVVQVVAVTRRGVRMQRRSKPSLVHLVGFVRLQLGVLFQWAFVVVLEGQFVVQIINALLQRVVAV